MQNRQRQAEAALRAADRQRREEAAGRLLAKVPALTGLEMALEERRNGAAQAESRHVRRFVVASAPALFELPCGDRACRDGGHDVTHKVMAHLRAGATHFEETDACNGSVGTTACGRVLHVVGTATYRAAP